MRIEIGKSKIPYIFTFKSRDEIYLLKIKHYKSNNGIYIDIMDEYGEILLENEKLIYGRPLGCFILEDESGNRNNDFLNCFIVPLSNSGKAEIITYDNFCETIFLEYYYLDEDDEDIEDE